MANEVYPLQMNALKVYVQICQRKNPQRNLSKFQVSEVSEFLAKKFNGTDPRWPFCYFIQLYQFQLCFSGG